MSRRFRIWLLAICGLALLCVPGAVADGADGVENRLHLDVRVGQVTAETEQLLRGAGLEIELAVPELGRWQGWLAAERMAELRRVPGVVSVGTPSYASFAAGDVLSEGDDALNAAAARRRFNVDGSGIRVAVISDGIRGLTQAQAAGEAPMLAEVWPDDDDDALNRGDEGTAMIEIVHDIAPGASISFAAVRTDLDLIAAVNHFAPRVDIIVDDVSFASPANQRSDVSVNTTRALEHPTWPLRLYVTAAGNWAESHWAGEWTPGVDGTQLGLPSPGAVHQFNRTNLESTLFGGGNAFRVNPGDLLSLALFWDDLPGRSSNDYNLYLMSAVGEVLASSETKQGIGVNSHDPIERLFYTHKGEATNLFAVIQNVNDDARPVSFHLFAVSSEPDDYRLHQRTPEGSILAQSDADGALTVAAVNVRTGLVASYSSHGPTLNGVNKPDLAAVDQVAVSENTRHGPRFGGSSAAAPHVAAIGALMLEAQPALLAADGGSPELERRLIRDLLIETATDLPPAGPDPASGAGLVNAEAAVNAALRGAITVTSAADSGFGSLRDALAGGAQMILFDASVEARTISLRSPLPPVRAGTIIDGAGWTLDASRIAVGLELGDDCELWALTVSGAGEAGVEIAGDGATVHGVRVLGGAVGVAVLGQDAKTVGAEIRENDSHGILIDAGGSAEVTGSLIEDNGGTGVQVGAGAVGALIGPPGLPPDLVAPHAQWPPIDPLSSAASEPRSGASLQLSGTVSLDGVPAPAGSLVNIYLDRRLAASVPLDPASRFFATITGPGEELRFTVDGAPLEYREAFSAGGERSVRLRAVSPGARVAAEPLAGANRIRGNQIGVVIEASSSAPAGPRLVWGNEIRGQRVSISSPWPAPVIESLAWSAAGINISGRAEGAEVAHLYAGPAESRQFAAAAPVVEDEFRFSDIAVDRDASHFSVIAHRPGNQSTAESDIHRIAAQGRIATVTPDAGYLEGGETVEICGSGLASDAIAPRVWFGNRPARVIFWSEECVTVSSPGASAGPVDITLLLNGSRPTVGVDAFEYRDVRVVKLRRGWNSVTWSGSATSVGSAFASLEDRDFRVYTWDAERQRWRLYATALPARLNTLRTLTHDQPLWMYLDGDDIEWVQPAPE